MSQKAVLCSAANISAVATAATTIIATTTTAKAITATAEHNDKNQDDPQAASSTEIIVPTHIKDLLSKITIVSCDLSLSYAGKSSLCFSSLQENI